MFELYFDESGTHDKGWLTLAGFAGHKDQWCKFSGEWLAALEPTPFSQFHAKEFFHWAKKPENGALAKDVLRNLIGVILRRSDRGFSYSMSVSEYLETVPPKFASTYGSPYAMCAQELLTAILDWSRKREYDGPFSYFFEDGHKNAHQLVKNFHELKSDKSFKIRSIRLASKEDLVPLQAADLLAYRMNRRVRGRDHGFLTDPDYEVRFSEHAHPCPCGDRKRFERMVRIPMMSISHSDLMPISSERSDAELSQCETVIDIRQEFLLVSWL
jgi:hypothetical protein